MNFELTNHLVMIFFLKMPSKYRCPLCNADDIIEYEKTIECPHCGRKWHKDFISGEIDEENILSDQELKGFLDTFDELKDEERRIKFLNPLTQKVLK